MSRIDKLSIQGIRNFVPENAEVIEFDPPVTLILGKNGSGKTTIIESLKYATTGEMPPGTNKGQNFIHNPNLTNKKMSIGKVQLMFRDEHDKCFSITRLMEAKMLNSKIEFKSIDNTLSCQQPDGKYIDIRNRVKDLNSFVSKTLGVSRALLNNVLFCHQEDSNWPLEEAGKVKQKFDDIFNTTRYVDCQDDIRKEIKRVKLDIKEIENAVKTSEILKNQADELRQDARKLAERKTAIDADMQQLELDKIELEIKVKDGQEKSRAAEKLKSDIQAKKLRLDELERIKRDLESDITQIISTSKEELQSEIEKFELTKNQRQMNLNEILKELKSLDKDCTENSAAQQEKLVQLGKLQSEEEQYKKKIKEKDDLLCHLAQRFQWAGCDRNLNQVLSIEQLSQYRQLLKEETERVMQEEAEIKRQLEAEERSLLDSLNNLREDRVRLEQNIQSRENVLNGHNWEYSTIEEKLGAMEDNARQMASIERQHSEAQREVEIVEKEVDVEVLMRDISRSKSEKSELEKELDKIRAQLNRVMAQRDVRLKMEMIQKQLSAKQTNERLIMSREHVEEAVKLLLCSGVDQENLLSHYGASLTELSDQLSKGQANLVKLTQEAATVEAELKNGRMILENKQAELNVYLEKMKRAGRTGANELEMDITELGKDIEELEDMRGAVHGSQKLYNGWIDKIVKKMAESATHKPDCPLCNRVFEENDDVSDVLSDLRKRVEAFPGKKAEYDRKIAEKKSKHEQLVQLRPAAQTSTYLAETELPLLRTELNRLEERSTKIANEVKEAKRSVENYRSQEDIGKKAHLDIIKMDALKNDIKMLQTQMESIKLELGSSDNEEDISVDVIQKRVEDAEDVVRSVTVNIELLNERYNRHQSKLSGLKQKTNSLMEQKLLLNDGLQQRGSLVQRKEDLEGHIDSAQADIQEWKMDLEPLIGKQIAAETAHLDAQKRRNVTMVEARKKVEDLVNQSRLLTNLDAEIQRWASLGKEAELERGGAEVERLKREKDQLEERKEELSTQSENMKLALSNCENDERNLRNNLKLIGNSTDRQLVKSELDRLTRELEGCKIQLLVNEIKQNEIQLETCKNKLSELKGSQQEMAKSIRDLELKLRREEFATAEEKWKEQVIDLEIHQAVSEDLSNFNKALESVLMKFHTERMEVINGMVREMWRSTYKGRDIDYVEVKAEEPTGTGNSRRQYNYRVVMVKNGIEMDMRGRCSAGQKVLASLIIRMALAQSFSAKCGVLALDEPTTNLDEDNIASLSDTILELASSITRQKRKFQLIVITHDEKFLERMSRDKRMEKFYRVDRNRQNASEIRQYDVMGGLQTKQK